MKILITASLVLLSFQGIAQGTAPVKPKKQSAGKTPEMNALLEEAMKKESMSEAEKEQTRKMMQGIMPGMNEKAQSQASYSEFTDNRSLLPEKASAKIAALKAKKGPVEINSYVTGLFNKLKLKGDQDETGLALKIMTQEKKASGLSNASVLCMLQGHPQASMLIGMKAVLTEPQNPVWQNNLAVLLTQYGYPETAIPMLRKLYGADPMNSSILNNLAYAWLGLGEKDSAGFYANAAIQVNPFHADSKLCMGLIEELTGDPVKAKDDYLESMEDGISPFTDHMLQNRNLQTQGEQLDFEKIKRTITIHEYFKKDFIPGIPLLKNGVENYTHNSSVKQGYQNMLDTLIRHINDMQMVLGKKLENLADKSEDDFVKEMSADISGNYSMISKPAAIITKILINYGKQWHEKMQEDENALIKKVGGYRAELDLVLKKNLPAEKCKIKDQAIDAFTAKVNPMVRQFFLGKAEELRQWTNAVCTWNWFVGGNMKNVILIQDIQMAGYLVQTYEAAIRSQEVIDGYCKSYPEGDAEYQPLPEIPNFSCPVVVQIPSGAEWAELTATSSNFDGNHLNVKQSSTPAPHTTISFTTGGRIGQPGFDASLRSTEGTLILDHTNISEYNKRMDELHRENLSIIGAIPDVSEYRHQKNLEMIKALPYWSEVLAIKAMITKMLTSSCNKPVKKKLPRIVVSSGELTFSGPEPIGQTETEDGYCIDFEDGSGICYGKDGSVLEFPAAETYQVKETEQTVRMKKVPDRPNDQGMIKLKTFKSQYDSDGLVPSLSSSMQMPGMFEVIKNLFN